MGMKLTESSMLKMFSRIDNAGADVEKAVVEAFAEAGDTVVVGIRSGKMSNWHDITGALRSSVGYVVCRKGRIIKSSDFETVLNGSEGSAMGRRISEKLAKEYARYEFALIIVAGEEYAVYVEAVDGKVVLAGGQLYVEKSIVNTMHEKIKKALVKYEK